jgi:hypothetical protein
MQSFVMMALGGYRFAVDSGGFEKFQRSTAWRWPSQERIGARPAQQFMGPGSDKITLSGTIFPHFKGGLGQVTAMRAEGGRGVALDLIDGNGFYYGAWVMLSVDEGKSVFLPDGTPRKIEFSVEEADARTGSAGGGGGQTGWGRDLERDGASEGDVREVKAGRAF